MVYVTKNNYVINDNKTKMAQGSGQRLKAEAEAQKPHYVGVLINNIRASRLSFII